METTQRHQFPALSLALLLLAAVLTGCSSSGSYGPGAGNFHTVVVDAGHGGHDGGAVANGVVEKNLSLDIAGRLKKELEAAGVRVVMTRSGDSFLSLDERAALAGKSAAALAVLRALTKQYPRELRGWRALAELSVEGVPTTTPLFAELLSPYMPVTRSEMLAEAIRQAMAAAKPGDIVLLSPACASFDQFADFADRGRAFCRLVEQLAGTTSGCDASGRPARTLL